MPLIYGNRPVREALRRPADLRRVYVLRGRRSLSRLADEARRRGVEVNVLDAVELERLCGDTRHQGLAAEVERRAATIAGIVSEARERDEEPFLVVCDHLEDPHNLGAVLRSAEAVGCHGAVIPSRRAAPVTGTVVRAAAGATAHLPVAVVGNVSQALRELIELEVWCAGLTGEAEQTIYEAALTGPLALVVGAEDKGLGHATAKACDYLIRIPLYGRVASLNASAAFAVAAFEALRQRRVLGR